VVKIGSVFGGVFRVGFYRL